MNIKANVFLVYRTSSKSVLQSESICACIFLLNFYEHNETMTN